MYEFPEHLKFSEEHLWVEVEENGVRVGLSDFAQAELGEIISLGLPKEGDEVDQATGVGEIEAEGNPAFEIVAPLSGLIKEINEELCDSPAALNDDPFGDGWLFVIDPGDDSEIDALLTSKEYEEKVEREGELI